jgi:hypothetical protein
MESWLRNDAGLATGLVGNTVWRIRPRPVWNIPAAGMPPRSLADSQVAPKRSLAIGYRPLSQVSGYVVSQGRP